MKSHLYLLEFPEGKSRCIHCTHCGKYFELSEKYYTMIVENYMQFPICYGCAEELIKNKVRVNKLKG